MCNRTTRWPIRKYLDENNSEDFQTGRGPRQSPIWQSEEYFIVTIDWLMESVRNFLKLDCLFKADHEVIIPAKTMQFILNLKNWQKLIKNRSIRHDNVINLIMKVTGRIIFKTTFRCPHDSIIRSKYDI